jgi:hypothetical protein
MRAVVIWLKDEKISIDDAGTTHRWSRGRAVKRNCRPGPPYPIITKVIGSTPAAKVLTPAAASRTKFQAANFQCEIPRVIVAASRYVYGRDARAFRLNAC